ncbi:uncharacterized protein E5676_scaffold758G00220 [Cucumis melo var. makuwa]|uniref:Envelope-like protein n=1 Tax=Cucumis melo var. makuwa TaxID=1194695 RepID=A0A5D3BXK3_CUCMM|nr:uncharacterized protein E5676_scaffold758G00220 [Cucumis melo var. makuwa]
MHGVWIRGHRFKITPPRRLYRLPLEKFQVNVSESSHLPVNDAVIAKNMFVLTPGHPPRKNEEASPSRRSLSSPTSVGSPAAYEHVEPTNTVELDVNDELQPETQQSPCVPRPKGKKKMFKDGGMLCNERLQMSSLDNQTIHIWGLKFKISPEVINGFLGNNVEPNSLPLNPSNEVLAFVLFGGTRSTWLVNGIPTVSLSIKYVILHKIGIANWFPSSHAFALDAPGLELKTLSLSYRLFQGSHIPNIEHGMRPSRAPRMFNTEDLGESVEVDSLIRHLKSLVPSTSTREHGFE